MLSDVSDEVHLVILFCIQVVWRLVESELVALTLC